MEAVSNKSGENSASGGKRGFYSKSTGQSVNSSRSSVVDDPAPSLSGAGAGADPDPYVYAQYTTDDGNTNYQYKVRQSIATILDLYTEPQGADPLIQGLARRKLRYARAVNVAAPYNSVKAIIPTIDFMNQLVIGDTEVVWTDGETYVLTSKLGEVQSVVDRR